MTAPTDWRALCAELVNAWTNGRDIAGPMARARTTLAQPESEGSATLNWSEERQPCEQCRYNHCIAETPFGRFLISWKGWKGYPAVTVDEAPFGEWFECWNSVEKAKSACQAEYSRRLAAAVGSLPSQPEPQGPQQGVSYRQLLAALESLIHKFDTEDCTTICELEPWKDLVSAAKDTQPEPQGPTDEEIEQEAVANADTDDEYRAFKRGAFFVQERIHRPVIQPVPVSERLPGAEDCDTEGRCWTTNYIPAQVYSPVWKKTELPQKSLKQDFSNAYFWRDVTYWLPHWALPVPEREP